MSTFPMFLVLQRLCQYLDMGWCSPAASPNDAGPFCHPLLCLLSKLTQASSSILLPAPDFRIPHFSTIGIRHELWPAVQVLCSEH